VEPETQYAGVDKERVAYKIVGDGPPDLVISAGTYGSIDLDWDDPMVASTYRRMARFSRVIRFDRRGSGASDPLPLDALPSWESFIDEIVAVMTPLRLSEPPSWASSTRGRWQHCSRPRNPIERLHSSWPIPQRGSWRRTIRWELPLALAEAAIDRVARTWGTEDQVRMQVPSRASDERFRRWFARYTRSIAGLTAVRAYLQAMLDADARSILSSVHVPTLVLHRKDYEKPHGAIYQTYPSLKRPEDRDALWDARLEGVLSTIATDEMCTTLKTKLRGRTVDDVTGGHAGAEVRMVVSYTESVEKRGATLNKFTELTSTSAAKILGMYPQKGVIQIGAMLT
jgi:pimeloyl-ACP methyl ester carboxylesterase